jgi:uncharacterized protein YndB with AHSA1/START domain
VALDRGALPQSKEASVKVEVQERTEIAKPPAEVYRFIATEHGRNHPRWDSGAVDMTQRDPGPVAVGTRFDYKRKAFGRIQVLELVVTEMEPDRKLAFRIEGPMRAKVSYTLEPGTPSRTVVHFVGLFEVPGPQLLAPLMKVGVNRETKGSQSRIKQMVEAGS